ncbi:MAG: glycosyltransferase family 4 protein [Patescibacteria group bacterium]
MKLVYFTSMRYPADNGMKIYARELAKSFTKLLKNRFVFVVANDTSDELTDINTFNLRLRLKKFRSPFFFFCIPYFVHRWRYEDDLVFFTNDTFLLTYFIFWKKIFRFDYRICSDWHNVLKTKKERFIIRNSDELVTTSNGLKRDLIQLGGATSEHICSAYGGVNLQLYADTQKASRAELGLPKGKTIIGYIGFFKTFGLEKGIPTMIESLAHLPASCVVACVGGKDAEIREYTKLAASFGVQDRCFFFGVKSSTEVAQYQMAMDIITIPYPNQPGFGYPMKVYEYMASQRPIIYSKLWLVEEVLGDCAYAFAPHDVAGFVLAVEEILADEALASRNVERAYEKVQDYTWDRKAERIAEFLER